MSGLLPCCFHASATAASLLAHRFILCCAGAVFSRFILTGVWKNLIDVLSTPLTGRMAGSSKGLAFILGAEGVKEQSQRERDTICLSLDGLRKAAALSCALGERNMCHMCLHQQEKQDTALILQEYFVFPPC